MDYLQEYKELYYKELEFKDTMSGKIGISISLLTTLCTGHIFMWDIMYKLDIIFHVIPIIFFLFECTSVIYTILAFIFFYKSYYALGYKLISSEQIINEIKNNRSLSKHYSKKEIANANYSMMCDTFCSFTIINRKENLRRNKARATMNSYIVKAFLFLVLTYTTWFLVINNYTF